MASNCSSVISEIASQTCFFSANDMPFEEKFLKCSYAGLGMHASIQYAEVGGGMLAVRSFRPQINAR